MKIRFFLISLITTIVSYGQTSLLAGDLVVTSLIADGNDRFEFIPLVDLSVGTVIYFTETGWNATTNSWRKDDLTEGVVQYTAPTAITRGTVISIEEDAISNGQINLPSDGSVSISNFGNSFWLSTSGDQIIAFQGTPPPGWDGSGTNPFPAPNFIFAITSHSTAWHDATSTNITAIPSGLTNGLTAVAAGSAEGSSNEYDNIYYDADTNPLTGKTKTEILALVGNVANWIGNDTEPTAWKISNFSLSSNQFANSEFSVVPNPVQNGFLKIQSQVSGLKSINVFDLNGRAVLSTQLEFEVLDVSSLDRGLYLLNIKVNESAITKKIFVK
ncbi:MAG: Uncharacterised protein [Formosa sp. Hel1_33_131]|jgi:hypothetical protein|nr:MAG: Uncharacterised protein [Formosa sp. Hel1_33_131]|tara:strand:+ start:1907 stop:2893 length:987 start_codon:yes stop_codon:yes gene_type:complete